MATLYDLMVLIDADAPEERRSAALSEIEHRPDAEYHLFQVRAGNEVLERLRQRLKIMDGVLRFRIIRNRSAATPPPSPDRQDRRQREEREPEGRVAARAAADAPAAE